MPVAASLEGDTSAVSGHLAMFGGRTSLVPRGPPTVRYEYPRQPRRFEMREDIP